MPGRAAADLSIVDDDIGGTIQFSAATYTVGEGAGSAAIVLTRTGGTGGGATVDFATSDGTGVAGTDYTTTTGTAVFAAAKTSLTFLVPILDNATPDGVRTVNLTLSNPGPNGTTHLGTRITAILKIVDNDVSLAFSAPTYSVKESVATATITVELAGVNAAPVTVTWATSDGTALAGSDYGTAGNLTPPTGTLTFPAGGTPTTVRTKTFPVRIIQDRVLEATETVNLTLSAPSPGAQLIAGARHRGAVDRGRRHRRRDAVLGRHLHGRGGRRHRLDRHHPHRQHGGRRDGRLRHQRRHRGGGDGLHDDGRHGRLRRRADLADVHGSRRRHAGSGRRAYGEPGADEPGS